METVKVKAKNQNYEGTMRGYKFHNGEAKDVSLQDAEYMASNFGVEIVKPEQPKQPEKPKQTQAKKAPAKKQTTRKTTSTKKEE